MELSDAIDQVVKETVKSGLHSTPDGILAAASNLIVADAVTKASILIRDALSQQN